jgi:hypothetical protein
MPLILFIDFVLVVVLVTVYKRRGLEAVLPYFVFIVTLLPDECRITLPGLFDLRAQRIAIITLAILFFTSKKRSKTFSIPLKRLMVVNFIWVLASTVVSIVFMTSIKQALTQLIEYYFLYYIFLKTITNVRTISKSLFAMVAAMSLCSVFGLIEIYAQWNVLSFFPLETQSTYGVLYRDAFDRGIRARSMFVHPIHFGAALAMVIPFAFYLLTTSKSWPQRAFLNLSLLLMSWGLYKTGSRGPWVAAAVAMVILTVGAEAKLRKRILKVAALASLVLILRPGIVDTLVNMYDATFDPASRMGSSFQYRPVLMRTVMETLNDNPLRAILGFGLGSFREKGLILEMPGIETHRWYTCDSTWILFLYETGYIGVLIVGTLLLRPAFLAFSSFRRLPRSDRYFSLVILSSLATFYVVMISVAIYGWGQNGHMLWIVFAMSIAYTILKKDELKSRTARSKIQPSRSEAWEGVRTIAGEGAMTIDEMELLATSVLSDDYSKAGSKPIKYSARKFYE